MNKRMNTVFFLLGATLFNVLVAVGSFIILFILYVRFILPGVPEGGQDWSFSIIFIAAIVVSFFSYRMLIKYLSKKIDFEKYFDPLFAKKNIKKN